MAIIFSILTSVILAAIVIFFVLHPHALRLCIRIVLVLLLALLCLELITRGVGNLSAGAGVVGSALILWIGWKVIQFYINS